MDTVIVFLDNDLPDDDLGNDNLITLGFVTVDAIRKKSNRKNIISFIADVCISAFVRCRFLLKFICSVLLISQ